MKLNIELHAPSLISCQRSVFVVYSIGNNDCVLQVYGLVHKELVESLYTFCPDAEYLVNAGWTPDGSRSGLNHIQYAIALP